MFKNLMFQTRHTRVAGIGNTKGSQRAMNLLFAIRDIQKRTGRDLGATFLSGTVVVNALTELYVMFKYMRPAELKRQIGRAALMRGRQYSPRKRQTMN